MSLHSMKIAFIRNSPDKTIEFFYIPDSIIRSYVFNKNYLTCDGDWLIDWCLTQTLAIFLFYIHTLLQHQNVGEIIGKL